MSKADKTDECQELKNIKYKTMLLNGNAVSDNTTYANVDNIDQIIQKDNNVNNENIPWNKLDKTTKINKLNLFVDKYCKDNKIASEKTALKKYLKECLEKKQLSRVKDVVYDKSKAMITSIPNLVFNKKSTKFTMKKSDKRLTTSKALAPKKPRKVKKTLKENNNKIDSELKEN